MGEERIGETCKSKEGKAIDMVNDNEGEDKNDIKKKKIGYRTRRKIREKNNLLLTSWFPFRYVVYFLFSDQSPGDGNCT